MKVAGVSRLEDQTPPKSRNSTFRTSGSLVFLDAISPPVASPAHLARCCCSCCPPFLLMLLPGWQTTETACSQPSSERKSEEFHDGDDAEDIQDIQDIQHVQVSPAAVPVLVENAKPVPSVAFEVLDAAYNHFAVGRSAATAALLDKPVLACGRNWCSPGRRTTSRSNPS